MSTNETGFIKILFVILILGVSQQFSGCAQHKSQSYSDRNNPTTKNEILNGTEVLSNEILSKKVLYLATGAQLLKTPKGGFTAKQSGQCTASAITQKFILTAAHCLKGLLASEDQSPESIYIVLSSKPWKTKFNSKLWYAAKKIFIHPNYKKTTLGGSPDDLALIQLQNEIPEENVTELASPQDLSSTMILTMAGYGMRSNLKNISEAESKKNLGELFQVTKVISSYEINQLTIQVDQHDQRGICSGDSGGPGLIFNPETQKYMTIGVVSGNRWFDEDKEIIDPQNKLDCFGFAVYTNVMNPSYYDWIQKTIL